MSQKAEGLEKLRKIVSHTQSSNLQWSLKAIESIVHHRVHEITQVSEESQELEIGLLNQRQHALEYEFRALEYEFRALKRDFRALGLKLNTPDSAKIEALVKKIFAEMPTIKSVYSRPTQSGFALITIHNSKTISNAIDQIQPGFAKLENEFPDVYFEPCILHSREVQKEHLQQSKMIFKR